MENKREKRQSKEKYHEKKLEKLENGEITRGKDAEGEGIL